MKPRLISPLFMAMITTFAALLTSFPIHAQQPKAKIRMLLITGGHEYPTSFYTLKMIIKTVALMLLIAAPASAQKPPPIIDMHLHAPAADAYGPPPVGLCVPLLPHIPPHDPKRAWGVVWAALGKNPPCRAPIWSPRTDEALIKETITILERRNVIGVLSGTAERVRRWSEAAPGRFIPGLMFALGDEAISPDSLRHLVATGAVKVLGEVGNQYAGIAPDDARMEPYWTLAEELDIPVGIHIGEGVPGAPYFARPAYRAR